MNEDSISKAVDSIESAASEIKNAITELEVSRKLTLKSVMQTIPSAHKVKLLFYTAIDGARMELSAPFSPESVKGRPNYFNGVESRMLEWPVSEIYSSRSEDHEIIIRLDGKYTLEKMNDGK